jgi:hypothetical protein
VIFTKVRIDGLGNGYVDLPIVGALPSDPYILLGIDGLGPTEVDVSVTNTLYQGGIFQGRRPQLREVGIRIGLNPDYAGGVTVESLREAIYRIFAGSSDMSDTEKVVLQIRNGAYEIARTPVYLKRLDPALFSKDPEVILTMATKSSTFEAPALVVISGGTISIPSPSFTIQGTAATGWLFQVKFLSTVSSWKLTDVNRPGEKLQIDYAFVANDILTFDSTPGARKITVTRGGVETNIIFALSADSVWRLLYPSTNNFTANTSSYQWLSVTYRPQFLGV